MRSKLSILLVLVAAACGTEPVVEEVENVQPSRTVTPPDTAPGPALVVDTSTQSPAPDTTAAQKPRPRASVLPELQCLEQIYVENNQGRITMFIPKRQLAARTSEIRELLLGVFLQAERTSPHSIADDFERGISTEYSSMPDKLPVDVLVYERCRSTKPHTVMHLRVWREADGSFGSDGW